MPGLWGAMIRHHRAKPARLRRTGACGRERDGQREPCGHPWCRGGRGSRGDACGQAWKVDRYVSRVVLRSRGRMPIELKGTAPILQRQKRAPAIALGASRPEGDAKFAGAYGVSQTGSQSGVLGKDEDYEAVMTAACSRACTAASTHLPPVSPAGCRRYHEITSPSASPWSSAMPRRDPPARDGEDSAPSSPHARPRRSLSRSPADPW